MAYGKYLCEAVPQAGGVVVCHVRVQYVDVRPCQREDDGGLAPVHEVAGLVPHELEVQRCVRGQLGEALGGEGVLNDAPGPGAVVEGHLLGDVIQGLKKEEGVVGTNLKDKRHDYNEKQ